METPCGWTEIERLYPNYRPTLDNDGMGECPECHGQGTICRRNFATLSPSDDYDETCGVCLGKGRIKINDDR